MQQKMRWPERQDLMDLGGPIMTATATKELEDYNGHVNVRHHYGFHIDATEALFVDQFGINEEWLARVGQSTFSVSQHLQFHGEIMIGDRLEVFLRLLGRSDKTLHGMSILFDITTGQVSSTMEYVEVYVDLATRKSTEMPSELTHQLDELLDVHQPLGWQLPLSERLGTSRRK